MKEHVQKPGVRKWAGEDLLELQGETLTALQALVEPYAPCIIQGCGVGQTDGVYQVQPGIVALKGSNEDGSACTKIVRFAGYTGEVLPVYLTIKVTPYMRVYADEENKPIAYEYTAEAFTNEPVDIPYLKIDASDGPRLVDTIGITQKLDREGGNASNVKVVSFKEDTAAGRINIAAGMTMKELFGRIYRWLRDLQPIAFKEKVEKDDFKDELKTEFNNKVDKDGNKVLSTNDFTNAMMDKLNDIETGAEVNVQADWSVTDTKSDAYIKNKPTASNIGGKLPIANGGTGETTAAAAAGALLNGLSQGSATPDVNANIIISGNGSTTYYRKPLSLLWNWIKSKLATVATTGNYNDLTNKPAIPAVNNGTITITQAGTTKGTFSLNQSGNQTIALTDNNTVYSHPSYTARTGVPAADQTPSFGGTFSVSQPVSDSSGHITALNSRTVKIPNNVATTFSAGLMSASDKTKLNGLGVIMPVAYLLSLSNFGSILRSGYPLYIEGSTYNGNPCYKISLTDSRFDRNKTYIIMAIPEIGHRVELSDTLVKGGGTTCAVYYDSLGTKAKVESSSPSILVFERN